MIRYKQEIMVLLYSRWGISFLRRDCEDESKRFDAFVLYNRHDKAFVLREMLPRLDIKMYISPTPYKEFQPY